MVEKTDCVGNPPVRKSSAVERPEVLAGGCRFWLARMASNHCWICCACAVAGGGDALGVVFPFGAGVEIGVLTAAMCLGAGVFFAAGGAGTDFFPGYVTTLWAWGTFGPAC